MTAPPADDERLERLLRSLTRLSDQIAEEAIAAAVEATRTRTRSVVRDLLLAELLDRVEDVAGSGQDTETAERPTSDRDAPRTRGPSDERCVYVYGAAKGGLTLPTDLLGVDGAPVEVLACGSLAALTSTVVADRWTQVGLDERLADPADLESAVVAHDHVLRVAAASGGVIPLRFASTRPSIEAVRSWLARMEPAISELLETFAELREWAVTARTADLARHGERLAGEDRGPGGEQNYLRRLAEDRRLAERLDADVARCARNCHERFVWLSVAQVVRPVPDGEAPDRRTGPPNVVLSASYLVPAWAESRLPQAAAELEEAHRDLELVVSLDGPLPPYHFVPDELLGESGA